MRDIDNNVLIILEAFNSWFKKNVKMSMRVIRTLIHIHFFLNVSRIIFYYIYSFLIKHFE